MRNINLSRAVPLAAMCGCVGRATCGCFGRRVRLLQHSAPHEVPSGSERGSFSLRERLSMSPIYTARSDVTDQNLNLFVTKHNLNPNLRYISLTLTKF